MKKLYYLAWIPIVMFIAGIIVSFFNVKLGAFLISPMILMICFAVFSRKLFGARCARCGRPIPQTSALVDYCQYCSKKVKV